MVYYRKYRPQQIRDLDSESLRETLYSVLVGNNLPHAFLFTGPKGLGKTSTARIVAKVVNCEHPLDKGEPCNMCNQCTAIRLGTNIDILEIDGASNRGIDEIRELRERVNLSPSSARKKVYIIDEVHMLTTEAFNALLKTIEEPPSHVLFIFCTTEPQKVPATIVSRCFHLTFNIASENEIVDSLKRIVNGENLTIEPEALQLIAGLADGGFRDAAKILEEIVSLSKDSPITKQIIEEKYHISSSAYIVKQLVQYIAERKIKESLELVQEIAKKGIDIKYLLMQLLNAFHAQLLLSAGVTIANSADIQPVTLSTVEISQLISLFSDAYSQIKLAVIPQLPLEIAIILSGQIDEVPIGLGEELPVTKIQKKHTIESLLKKQQAIRIKEILGKKVIDTSIVSPVLSKTVLQSDINSQPDTLTTLFENIIYKVKPLNHSVAGVLRGSRIKEVTENTIVFETAYKFHKERLEDKKTCEIIEKAIKDVTGKNLKVSVSLKK